MNAEEQKMWKFIEAYLQERPPVYWAAWWGRCQDETARKRVESVLFQNGGLRDLTDLKVKQAVLDVIRQEPAMMQLVIADFAEEVARVEKAGREMFTLPPAGFRPHDTPSPVFPAGPSI